MSMTKHASIDMPDPTPRQRIDIYLHTNSHGDAWERRIEDLLQLIINQGKTMTNDLTGLQTKLAEVDAKSDETVATLTGLAQAVVDLKNAVDQQSAIDALTATAQGILDKLTTAEDAADDQLPVAP